MNADVSEALAAPTCMHVGSCTFDLRPTPLAISPVKRVSILGGGGGGGGGSICDGV